MDLGQDFVERTTSPALYEPGDRPAVSTLRSSRTRVPTEHGQRRGRRYRGSDSYDSLEPDLAELQHMSSGDPGRAPLRDDIITRCVPLADHIAQRFAGRGEPLEDLQQVARIGVIQAVDRFAAERGTSFVAYAVPTVMGCVRRHFRDHTWAVRVPRRIKEIQSALPAAVEVLTQRLGRAPRSGELAAELGIDLEELTQAHIAANGYRSFPVDAGSADDGGVVTRLDEAAGGRDPEYERIEQTVAVQPLISRLPARDRRILWMRFFESKTQSEIAAELGVSQMQISRVLTRTVHHVREQLAAETSTDSATFAPNER